MKKKIFAVSDIHGYFTEFKNSLDASGFENGNPEHLLIFCGDLFDRGTENLKVLQFFERTGNCVIIKGNHEDLLTEIFRTNKLQAHNYINGSMETLSEFFGERAIDYFGNIDFSGKNRTVDRICDLIGKMKNYFETENYVFVHGWIPVSEGCEGFRPSQNWRETTEEQWKKARWTKWTDMYGRCEQIEKTVVCGHMPTFFAKRFDEQREDMEASPFYGNGVIAIDGGTHDTGKVNIVVLKDEMD